MEDLFKKAMIENRNRQSLDEKKARIKNLLEKYEGDNTDFLDEVIEINKRAKGEEKLDSKDLLPKEEKERLAEDEHYLRTPAGVKDKTIKARKEALKMILDKNKD